MKIIKYLLSTIILSCSTALASEALSVASGLNVKFGAFAVFESGFAKQEKLKGSEKNISANKKGMAFFNNTAFVASMKSIIYPCMLLKIYAPVHYI